LEQEVTHFQLLPYINKIIGLDNNFAFGKIENGKNYLKELTCEPSEIILVGDTLHDAEVAEAMGVDCILISHGHQNHQRLSVSKYQIIDTLDELKNKIVQ